jgi:DNA-binding HxlR family transcriptional regulator
MKRYGQFCAVARALDRIGDRWTLLIVRELLLRPSRFTDLLDGLPGIPRNLLADRLRALAGDGLVANDAGRYTLTERGLELRPAIRALAMFGATELMTGPDGDAVRGRWIATAVDARFADDPEVRVLRADDDEVVLDVHGDELRGRPEDVMRRLARDARA